MNLTSLEYTGNVKIDLTFKDKTFTIYTHNGGSYFLMKTFAKILTGNVSSLKYCVPEFLDLEFVDLTDMPPGYVIKESDWSSYLRQPVELTSKQAYPPIDSAAIEPYAEFTALLLSSNLTELITEINLNKSYRIVLKTALDPSLNGGLGGYHTIATIPVTQEVLMKISPGTLVTITWDMKVSNKVSTQ